MIRGSHQTVEGARVTTVTSTDDELPGLLEVLARLGGRPHPLLRAIIAPSEKRIRTVLQEIDAARLDELAGGWLRGLADAGRLENLLRAVAHARLPAAMRPDHKRRCRSVLCDAFPGLVTAIQAVDDEPVTTSTSRPAT